MIAVNSVVELVADLLTQDVKFPERQEEIHPPAPAGRLVAIYGLTAAPEPATHAQDTPGGQGAAKMPRMCSPVTTRRPPKLSWTPCISRATTGSSLRHSRPASPTSRAPH